MDSYSGHASRGDPGPLVGAFYIKKLIERWALVIYKIETYEITIYISLTNATGDAESLYLEFGHETSILMPLSTMGLNKLVLTSDEGCH